MIIIEKLLPDASKSSMMKVSLSFVFVMIRRVSSFLLFILLTSLSVFASNTSYGPVGNESLRDIAAVYSEQSSSSTEQWIVGIWQNNPSSFVEQNLFALKPNTVLSIPDEAQIQNIDPNNAQATIQSQLTSWQTLFNNQVNPNSDIGDSVAYDASLHLYEKSDKPHVASKSTLLDKFLLAMLRSTHYMQNKAQTLTSFLFSKRFIPLLVIISGMSLLACTLWFAYTSARREQKDKLSALVEVQSKRVGAAGSSPLSSQSEDASDYNVFAPTEGIPIKLDLASAYINMQDLDSAKGVLQEIIDLHPGKTASEAKTILAEIV